MLETKSINKEASKEKVENLIVDLSKTIEVLYEKELEDIPFLKEQNADVPQLLRMAVELRMNMRFILMDLMISLRSSLNATSTFEKCYHIKNLEGIRVEGNCLLFGYRKVGEGSEWMKLGDELRQEFQRFKKSNFAQVYEQLISFYDRKTPILKTVMTTYEERKSRNITYHLDDDLYKVYKQLIKVKDEGEDGAVKCVVQWMDILLWILDFCNCIEYVMALRGYAFSKGTSCHHVQINVINLEFYKHIVSELSKNDQLEEILGKVIKDIDSVDWTAKEKDKLGRLEDWLGENVPKTIKDMKDLMNVWLLVKMSFADMACVTRAFMNSGSDIEYPLTFRRMLVSKVSALGHLVGYNEAEKRNALWTLIQKAIPIDAVNLNVEAKEIRTELESLLKQEDVKQRALYVHYMDRDTHESNVLRILESIEELDRLTEIKDSSSFIRIMGRIQNFLYSLMIEFAIRIDKTTKVSNDKMKSQIKILRQFLNNPKCPANLRSLFNKTLEPLEKYL